MSLEDSKVVVDRVTEILRIIGWNKMIHFSQMTEQMKLDYLKKWGIDHDAMNTIIERAVIESPSGEIAVIINETDHIRIVAKHAGMSLFKTYEDIYFILKSIESSFSYAFDEELGYITAELAKMGTGLQASVMLHLPTIIDEDVLEFATEYVFIKPVLQVDTARFYHVHNALTLGLSETDLLAVVQSTVVELIRVEYANRQKNIEVNRISVEDSVFRAFGIAQYAKIVQFEEMVIVLSSMRFGVELEMLDETYADKIDRLVYTIVAEQSMGFSSKSKDNIRQIRFAHMLKSLFQGEVTASV
jgi:protein arginine kinase